MNFGDTLCKVCKVSAIHSMAALSKFLHVPVALEECTVDIYQEDMFELDSLNEKVVSIYLPINGNLSGASFSFYPKNSALKICDVLHKNTYAYQPKEFSQLEISTLSEVTNILLGNFLTSFAQALQLDFLIHHVAIFDYDLYDTIFGKIQDVNRDMLEGSAIIFCVKFSCLNMKGCFLVMFNQEKINLLMNQTAFINSKDINHAQQ